MASFFHTLRRFWNNFTTSGAGEKLSMEQRRRVVFLNSINMIGIMILLAFGINRYIGNDINTAIADLTAGGILLVIFIYMRIRKKFLLASYTIVISIFLLFTFLLYDGGLDLSSSLWIQTFPLVAIFILGLLPGLVISGLYFLGACAIVFLPHFSRMNYGFNFGLRIIGSYILVFTFAIFYEAARRETQGKLEKISDDLLVAKKQTDSIMTNVKEGIFLLDETINFGSEYSRELETIFGVKELENRSFLGLLADKIDKKIFKSCQDYLEMFFRPEINPELLEEINPLEKVELHFLSEEAGFSVKHLEFTFTPISRDGRKVHILGTVKDISEEVELGQKLKAQETKSKKQMESLFQIINVGPDMLTEFIIDSEAEIENVNKLLKSDEKDFMHVVNSIFQSVHAVKGNTILLGLSHFSQKLHAIEDEINKIREKNVAWNDLLNLTIRLTEIQNEINEIKELIKRVLTFQDNKELKKIEQKDLLLNAVQRTINVMSGEQGKQVVLQSAKFDSRFITSRQRKVVKDILIQLTRNALAHGIETPEERAELLKEKNGTITIASSVTDGKFTISFKDDGRGLDVKNIKEKAKSMDAFKNADLDGMSASKLVGLIFHPRFTTAGNVSLASGRGIGLNLIKSLIEKSGGNMKIKSAKGKFCEFIITLPL